MLIVLLADEYDAAQERGEVRSQDDGHSKKGISDQNALPPTLSDIGLTKGHDARPVRDAEVEFRWMDPDSPVLAMARARPGDRSGRTQAYRGTSADSSR
jgi:hypothetical protein